MSYHTLTTPFRWQAEPIKGSRFLVVLHPVHDGEDARSVVDALRTEFRDASHHVWAWRLADGTTRCDDDGEPGGSAGRPVLAQLEGHDTADVVAVVMRWFGGTKLGVGGLMRAYGGSAGKALDAAPRVVVAPQAELALTFDYGVTNAVDAVLAAHDHRVVDTRYDVLVHRVIQVPVAEADRLATALTDRSGGQVRVVVDRSGRHDRDLG